MPPGSSWRTDIITPTRRLCTHGERPRYRTAKARKNSRRLIMDDLAKVAVRFKTAQ
jgi:hypothetical protein